MDLLFQLLNDAYIARQGPAETAIGSQFPGRRPRSHLLRMGRSIPHAPITSDL